MQKPAISKYLTFFPFRTEWCTVCLFVATVRKVKLNMRALWLIYLNYFGNSDSFFSTWKEGIYSYAMHVIGCGCHIGSWSRINDEALIIKVDFFTFSNRTDATHIIYIYIVCLLVCGLTSASPSLDRLPTYETYSLHEHIKRWAFSAIGTVKVHSWLCSIQKKNSRLHSIFTDHWPVVNVCASFFFFLALVEWI